MKVCLPAKVDAAFNLMSSFQILPTERAAEDHLRSMAANIAKGGLYILALHLTPSHEYHQRRALAATPLTISGGVR
ncbi:hypothetical protein [Bradyrhizobium tunisiense]|uniref:hypothetical protein n=1 Tax=Bradyrhizobium tunisiense TaxID=3278709 RepID=UPI0035D6A959